VTTNTSKSASSHSAGSGSKTMAELMANHTTPLITLHKGEEVEGIITKLTSSEILLDVHAKTEAVVLEKEKKYMRAILSLLKVGDKVKVSVLNPESDTGNAVVSLRRFLDNRVWERLAKVEKNHEKISVVIKGITKGGFTVETAEGLDGFLPNSHVSFQQDTQDFIGQALDVMIVELHPETHKLIVSQKTILDSAGFTDLTKIFKVGQKISAMISHIAAFGVFVSIPTNDKEVFLDGFIHISEISWDKVTEIGTLYAVGDKIEAIVIGFDTNAKRIDLSIKRLTADPFEEALKQYTIDQKTTGTIAKISDTGVVINLGNEGIEGFIRKEKIPPTTKYEIGQKVTVTVSQIDTKKHRIYLTPVLLEKPLTYR
jgi:small subunit ribosomal protein S1